MAQAGGKDPSKVAQAVEGGDGEAGNRFLPLICSVISLSVTPRGIVGR